MSKSAYIKALALMLALTIESLLLTFEILKYVNHGDYFSYQPTAFANISLLMLFILYTYALTIGGWKKWEQYIMVPLPIALGIFVVMMGVNITYAILIALMAFLIISYDIAIVTNIKNNLIKFNPVTVLRYSTKGILFVFSLLAFVMVVLNSTGNEVLDLSSKIAEITNKQFKGYLESKFQQPVLEDITGINLPYDISQYLNSEGSETTPSLPLPGLNLDIENTVKTEVDNIIMPYKQFVPSIIALVVYALIRFLGALSHLIFDLTAWFLFVMAKRANFIHSTIVIVEKEEISFNKVDKAREPKQVQKPSSPQLF